jgi:CHAT domain-containing protein
VQQWLGQFQLNVAAALRLGPEAGAVRALRLSALRMLQQLHAALLGPLALRPEACRRLVIVPYGGLHYLPFHLLHDGAHHLIEQHEVVVLPAAGLAPRPGVRQPPGTLALAYDWEGRLPHTHAEADLVKRLFGGSVWTDEAARRPVLQASPRQVLHVAAHGQYRLDQPDLSYLQLADGPVYADDLLQHDLSYELVTLSACETGRATVAGGEELIGLGRGLLYAGAGALVLSLWSVADASTLRLMEGFYRRLRDGASKAAALRQAQCALLAETPELHPAFWGAFQFVGDARPLSTTLET